MLVCGKDSLTQSNKLTNLCVNCKLSRTLKILGFQQFMKYMYIKYIEYSLQLSESGVEGSPPPS